MPMRTIAAASGLALLALACAAGRTAGDTTTVDAARPDSGRGDAAGATVAAAGDEEIPFSASRWKAPAVSEIGDDSIGASVRRGLALITDTHDSLPRYAPGNIDCTNCHTDGGRNVEAAPLTGSHARFPKYMDRTGAVITLADRVNYCFTRSLAGTKIPQDSREMEDILAYLAFLSKGVPVGAKTPGAGGLVAMPTGIVGDTTRGAQVYASTCASCHGAGGAGNRGMAPGIPALWGPTSYSVGASMAREERAASFIWHNMPFGNPKSLTHQQAFDVAAFIDAKPRPDSPGKAEDWPLGGAPKDVPYDTRSGHPAYRPPARLLPRANPAGAIVPKPRRIASAPAPGRGTP